MRAALRLVGFGLLALGLAACSGDADREMVSVFAASSLTDAFASIEEAFEDEYPEFDVQLNVAGSSALREQVRAGAPADVLAVANEAIATQLADEGLIDIEQVFATNSLTVALAPDNPGAISSIADLSNEELLLGVCAAGVPCGDLAVQSFAALGMSILPDTEEPDVRSLLAKIEAGELDAGVVYETDVMGSSADLGVLDLGLQTPIVTSYPLALVNDGPNAEGALAFVSFVFSEEGRAILVESGFGLPE